MHRGIHIPDYVEGEMCLWMYTYTYACISVCVYTHDVTVGHIERWGAGVEYHFQEFNEPYAPS